MKYWNEFEQKFYAIIKCAAYFFERMNMRYDISKVLFWIVAGLTVGLVISFSFYILRFLLPIFILTFCFYGLLNFFRTSRKPLKNKNINKDNVIDVEYTIVKDD